MTQERTCANCARSKLETHTGDVHRVCWKESYGRRVDDSHTCGAWREPERAKRERRWPW